MLYELAKDTFTQLTYLAVAGEKIICESVVGFEHVGLDASWGLHGHLGAVL